MCCNEPTCPSFLFNNRCIVSSARSARVRMKARKYFSLPKVDYGTEKRAVDVQFDGFPAPLQLAKYGAAAYTKKENEKKK